MVLLGADSGTLREWVAPQTELAEIDSLKQIPQVQIL